MLLGLHASWPFCCITCGDQDNITILCDSCLSVILLHILFRFLTRITYSLPSHLKLGNSVVVLLQIKNFPEQNAPEQLLQK